MHPRPTGIQLKTLKWLGEELDQIRSEADLLVASLSPEESSPHVESRLEFLEEKLQCLRQKLVFEKNNLHPKR